MSAPTVEQTEAVLAWLEPIDKGWGGMPDIDIRARSYSRLPDPNPGPDPLEVLAELYVNSVIRPVELPMIEHGPCAGQIDWREAYYKAERQKEAPNVTCPECGPPPAGRGSIVRAGLLHGGDGWAKCSLYVAAEHRCHHTHPWEYAVPGDHYGCLTACCGCAWSINDGPPYCKCCYATIDPSHDRHEIYRMWESPDLRHFAERIARLV